MPCIAECGGFLYLHRELEGQEGVFYPMAGVLDAKAYRTDRLGRFGYITLTAEEGWKFADMNFITGTVSSAERVFMRRNQWENGNGTV